MQLDIVWVPVMEDTPVVALLEHIPAVTTSLASWNYSHFILVIGCFRVIQHDVPHEIRIIAVNNGLEASVRNPTWSWSKAHLLGSLKVLKIPPSIHPSIQPSIYHLKKNVLQRITYEYKNIN